jgi:hypothetical protein
MRLSGRLADQQQGSENGHLRDGFLELVSSDNPPSTLSSFSPLEIADLCRGA